MKFHQCLFKTCGLSIFEWSLKTGLSVYLFSVTVHTGDKPCTTLIKRPWDSNSKSIIFRYNKIYNQLTGSSDFTLKSLLPVNWQQPF